MIRSLRNRQPGTPLWRIVAWYAMMLVCYVWFFVCYRYRAHGVRHIPDTGPLLLVANHQSYYDPILVGLGAHRRQFYALARASLFRNRLFAGLIRLLNAIPVEQGKADTSAMRRCVEVLGQGHALLIFPEGARTETGTTQPFESGLMLLIKRARPTVLPVALEGAYDVWPRGRARPRLFGRTAARFGTPIAADELLNMPAEAALERLRDEVEAMRRELAAQLVEKRR